MKRLIAGLAAGGVLAVGCGGQGLTVAQRCHTYAVNHARGDKATQPVWEQLCNEHPKLLTLKH